MGHDIFCKGNCPAESKCNIINNWPLSVSGQLLFSFIVLLNFYHRYTPYMEMKLKPLRRLVKTFYRNEIPSSTWTPELVKLFTDLKICITSSPILARFYPTKHTFLKTDWSSNDIGWIFVKPTDNNESLKATAHLAETGICLFELSKMGLY